MAVRRVATGHDEAGKSVVVFDGPTPGHFENGRATFDELWATDGHPPRLAGDEDPADVERAVLQPSPGGIRWRVVTYPPERAGPATPAEPLATVDGGDAYEEGDPRWHTTHSIDFGIVLAGEIVLALDDEEVHLQAGDCVVQRGTRHAWYNRSSEPAIMSFVLISADASAPQQADTTEADG